MGNLLNMSGGSLLKKGLPYDYEVEYLESTGTQYIDTGKKYNSDNIEIFTKFSSSFGMRYNMVVYSFLNNSNYGIVIAIREKGHFNIVCGNNEVLQTGYQIPKDTFTNAHIVANNGICEFTCNEGSSRLTYTNTVVNNVNVSILRNNTRMAFFKFYDNGLLVCDFIPVVKDNIGYMYDKVSGTLFGNAGTGNFIVGPRVS